MRQNVSEGHDEFQESVHKSDPGKWINLHISKMAANETSTYYLLRFYGWFYTL